MSQNKTVKGQMEIANKFHDKSNKQKPVLPDKILKQSIKKER